MHRLLIANPPNSAQLGGNPYHSPKLCSSVGMRLGTDSHILTHTDTRDQYTFHIVYKSREM